MKSFMLMAALVGCALAEGPSLAVYKSFEKPDVVAGNDVKVTVTVYNKGNAAAFDVKMDDSNWGAGIAGGKQEWAQIAADESVSATYTVSPTAAGTVMSVEPAKVTFAAEKGAETVKVAFSNHVYDASKSEGVDVLSQAEFDKKTSLRVKEWFTYLLLLVIPLGMPFIFYQQSNNTLVARRSAEQKAETDVASKKKASPGKKSSGRKN